MSNVRVSNGNRKTAERGFTLVELLVVVAIIALLISILLPSLSGARKQARTVRCATNLHSVGQAFSIYLTENNACYPPSYIYASNRSGGYDLQAQPSSPNENGYLHWSWFLYQRGAVKDEVFACPEFQNGGLPRCNPGPQAQNWEAGQVDDNGATKNAVPDNAVEDRQAPRVAYTANGAVVPRNKFTTELSGGLRVNKLVQEREIMDPRGVILAGEFNNDWRVTTADNNPGLCKSHRPVVAFESQGVGNQVYQQPPTIPLLLQYGEPYAADFGLQSLGWIRSYGPGLIDHPSGTMTNVIGRHHPGGDQLGGTANFLFTDGHTDRTTILETMKKRQWGAKFYSITGSGTEVGYLEHQ